MSLEQPTEEEIQAALKYDSYRVADYLGPLQDGGPINHLQNGIAAVHILQVEVRRLRALVKEQ